MRILVTCNRYPGLPLDGLTLRVFYYVRYLSDRHEFDLVCLDDTTETNPEIEAFFQQVHRFPVPTPTKPTRLLEKIASGLDPSTLFPISPAVQTCVRDLHARRAYDLIWDAGCNMLFNLAELRRTVPLLADQVDDNFLALIREIRLAKSTYEKLWLSKEMLLQWFFSIRHLRTAGSILFVSQSDQASFHRWVPFSRTDVIENGVEESVFDPSLEHGQIPDPAGPDIVFEGSMCFPPNIDAARYFVSSIFPLIRQAHPGVHFTLVGREPDAAVLALAEEGIEVTGSVPDVRPYLKRAAVFVCPMRGGAGIKNKILQAWAMGKAIVSTPEGVGSLKVEEGVNILVRDTPESFASAVLELIRDPDRALALGKAGRETILAHYTWAAKARELESLMLRITGRTASGIGEKAA